MPLIRSDIFTAFREAGMTHEHALRLAEVLTTPQAAPGPPPVPLMPSGWLLGLTILLLGSCLLFAGYILCQQGHVADQAARTRALQGTVPPPPHP